ncbi:glyoxalase [Enterobacter sp. RHBSTW-00994]|uniref:glyoxalase n=1 Tax=Enterobacteriaceae TaxID=543 RepID=UPI0015E9614D|nr:MULTISPECIES: glyoxalase [Enterobacteriaceae]MBM3072464.1 glyoxalase [Lelliottia sp. RWM.1]QLR41298.1 glyoxalase [Enterobacter sp. RHBSTW-00994]
MEHEITGVEVLFVAGFGPITRHTETSTSFYLRTLGLPLKPMEGNEDYLLTEQDQLSGVKHFALWPLSQAASSCFGSEQWPADVPVPQAWIEFEVQDIDTATDALITQGYTLLIAKREEPWGQTVTRLLSPEGLLTGVTITPWLRG